ncbi:hypothetical protein PoB_001552100 [Plakobranchus ocellatus]|uniref:Uncharacterized protein n=1 Tax=Plakobranchus ocellatus TaxID=259542 RepID=A0AAV3YPF5_9GAST|nr:hypothetical protein PoB_001552100 [Plakobranchus ocellatus]
MGIPCRGAILLYTLHLDGEAPILREIRCRFLNIYMMEPSILWERYCCILDTKRIKLPYQRRGAAVFWTPRGLNSHSKREVLPYSGHLEDYTPIPKEICCCILDT